MTSPSSPQQQQLRSRGIEENLASMLIENLDESQPVSEAAASEDNEQEADNSYTQGVSNEKELAQYREFWTTKKRAKRLCFILSAAIVVVTILMYQIGYFEIVCNKGNNISDLSASTKNSFTTAITDAEKDVKSTCSPHNLYIIEHAYLVISHAAVGVWCCCCQVEESEKIKEQKTRIEELKKTLGERDKTIEELKKSSEEKKKKVQEAVNGS